MQRCWPTTKSIPTQYNHLLFGIGRRRITIRTVPQLCGGRGQCFGLDRCVGSKAVDKL